MKVIAQKDCVIADIVQSLKDGKTLVYPTETCYGLGCDAKNVDAVKRIFAIKERQEDKPLLVVIAELPMIMECVNWSRTLEELAQNYWPGPLTVVAPARAECDLAPGVLGEDCTVAFRMTSHPLAAALSKGLNGPLVSTSANISAHESPYDSEAVLTMFGDGAKNRPDVMIDAGELPHHSPSTVVKVVGRHIQVLRQGEVVV